MASACKECGGDAVNHRLVYITVAIDETLRPLFAPGPLVRWFADIFYALERRFTPVFFSFLIGIGLARALSAYDDRTPLLAQMLWEEAKRRGIDMEEIRIFNLPRNIYIARLPSGKRIAFEGIPLPNSGLTQAWWMDNKAEMKRRFTRAGFPVAQGGAAFTEAGALRLFRKLSPPAIVKPYSGSGSRHTTLHIMDEQELRRAFTVAKELAPLAIVEEELEGPVFRATCVAGKFAAALRRDPPYVVGDGVKTVTELVAKANENPKRHGPYFHEIALDNAALEELRYQGLTPASVPAEGKRVLLNQKVNWSVGGTTADVTDEVHPENVQLFEAAAQALKAPIVGFDFIGRDLATSWKDLPRAGFIEANSMPFFDNHHLPFEGKPRNVAALIWDLIEPAKPAV